MKKRIYLILLCGIVLLGVCGCGNEYESVKYDRNIIKDNNENLKAYCKSILPSGVYETKLIGNDKQTVLKAYEEIETIDKLCSIQKEIIMGYDENAEYSCEYKDEDSYIIKYEYLVNNSIKESVKKLENEKYSCIIYNDKITDERILGTWCKYEKDGSLSKGNHKMILNEDGTMKTSENYGGVWGESNYNTYYSFENETMIYLMQYNNHTKLELKYNSKDDTLTNSSETYWKKCN